MRNCKRDEMVMRNDEKNIQKGKGDDDILRIYSKEIYGL